MTPLSGQSKKRAHAKKKAASNMKINLSYRRLNAQAAWQQRVEEQLNHLANLTAITSADVIIEHQREIKPAYLVRVQLVVPGPREHAEATTHVRKVSAQLHGPAIHAEARDNTVEAALLKAMRELEDRIKAHQLRHLEQGKSQLHVGGVANRWIGA
jgi:ribosome-associated translation inhibitor RaiA